MIQQCPSLRSDDSIRYQSFESLELSKSCLGGAVEDAVLIDATDPLHHFDEIARRSAAQGGSRHFGAGFEGRNKHRRGSAPRHDVGHAAPECDHVEVGIILSAGRSCVLLVSDTEQRWSVDMHQDCSNSSPIGVELNIGPRAVVRKSGVFRLDSNEVRIAGGQSLPHTAVVSQ